MALSSARSDAHELGRALDGSAGGLVAFEVSVLSINWIVLITSGVLLAVVFRRAEPS